MILVSPPVTRSVAVAANLVQRPTRCKRLERHGARDGVTAHDSARPEFWARRLTQPVCELYIIFTQYGLQAEPIGAMLRFTGDRCQGTGSLTEGLA